MAGKSSQSNNRGTDLFGYFVSGKHKEYHTNQFAGDGVGGGGGHSASGGIISEYVDGDLVYRAHVFTASGAFQISTLGPDATVDITAIGGGGGGSGSIPNYWAGAGGGAGGMLEVEGYPVSATTYPVDIGAGGVGSPIGNPSSTHGVAGGDTSFNNPGQTPISVIAKGGGGGGGSGPSVPGPHARGLGGGSCGGCGSKPGLSPTTTPAIVTHPNNPTINALSGCSINHYGNVGGGGQNGNVGEATGGGGAGGAGTGVTPPLVATHSNAGGAGRANVYAYGPSNSQTYAAGGGGGPATGGITSGAAATGGGGNGGANPNSAEQGGNGAGGLVIVRYKIASLSGSKKATGGAISYYNNKVIHTFNYTGTFANPTALNGGQSNPLNAEYVVVAGGGGGAGGYGGGGGAGGYRTGSTTVASGSSFAVQVGAGGRGGVAGYNEDGIQGVSSSAAFPGGTITAAGGGAGGAGGAGAGPGGGGGSGGGSAVGGAAGPATPPGQGCNGGQGYPSGYYAGGGGGGANSPSTSGGIGQDGSSGAGGNGGAGQQVPATFQNPNTNYDPDAQWTLAGGGGGGYYGVPGSATPGTGAAGGGGAGGTRGGPGLGGHGLDGTGGGGGAATVGPADPDVYNGGNGGSGIVLIAYPA